MNVFFVFDDGSIVLPGGGYWLSIAVYDTFSNGERALFCFSSRCRPACQVDFNPAAAADALSLASGGTWSSLPGREVSFLIAGERIDRMYTSGQGGDSPTGGNGGGSGTGCAMTIERAVVQRSWRSMLPERKKRSWAASGA